MFVYRHFRSGICFLILLLFPFLLYSQEDEIGFLRSTVKYLSSDELQGRAAGTEGAQKAAAFLAEQLRRIGVQPIGAWYFQEFEVPVDVQLGEKNFCEIQVVVPLPGVSYERALLKKLQLQLGKDWIPLGFSRDTLLTDKDLVFCGYGITAPALHYDDYENVDVSGKVAIILRETPDTTGDPHSPFRRFASLRYKAINAREHGAAAVVFVSREGDSADVLIRLELSGLGKSVGIPVIHMKRSLAAKFFPPEKTLFISEQQINRTGKPNSFLLPRVKITLQTDVDLVYSKTQNVVGIIKGTSSSRNEKYIVIGAHYDHLGFGRFGSLHEGKFPAIHHGADDNASGVATVLLIAKKIVQNPLPYSVVVAFFSAEEMGLLGSQYFVEHPPIPLERIIAMINFDMVGRFRDNKLTIMGTGTSSTWERIIDSIEQRFHIHVSETADGFGPSDHASFYAKNIPVLFLFTGLHSDYHRPSDTWDKLHYEGMYTIAEIGQYILHSISSLPEEPEFTKVQQPQRRSGGRLNIYLGTIPDYSDHPKGLRIAGVREGSPAERGGLREGDIIIRVGDNQVRDIYDYMYALSQYNPGDTLSITVLRGKLEDQEVVLKVIAGSR